MNCREFEAQIDFYLDGVLDAPSIRVAADHISVCPKCETMVTDSQQVSALLKTAVSDRIAAVDVSGLWDSIERELGPAAPVSTDRFEDARAPQAAGWLHALHAGWRSLVDSASAMTNGDSPKDYILNALAGAPTGAKADEFVAFTLERWGLDSLTTHTHWLIGVWKAGNGDLEAAREHYRYLADSVRIEGKRSHHLLAESLASHIALAEGDTTRAMFLLRSLKPTAPRRILWWRRAEPLPVGRLRLGELLLATGEYEEALVTASGFDHHAPAAYVIFIPKSLVIRIEAARALGRDDLVALYRQRLEKLGRDDLL